MKKVITWYQILKDMPFFNESPAAEEPAADAAISASETEKTAVKVKKAPAAPKAVAKQPAPKAAAKPKATVKARRAE